jgi:hypothetical protein
MPNLIPLKFGHLECYIRVDVNQVESECGELAVTLVVIILQCHQNSD